MNNGCGVRPAWKFVGCISSLECSDQRVTLGGWSLWKLLKEREVQSYVSLGW